MGKKTEAHKFNSFPSIPLGLNGCYQQTLNRYRITASEDVSSWWQMPRLTQSSQNAVAIAFFLFLLLCVFQLYVFVLSFYRI